MARNNLEAILDDPKFQELVQKRTSFAWTLSIIMLVIYFGFILFVAFGKSVLATPIFGGLMTVGIPLGIGVILSAFLLTGIYVARANSEFDDLNRQILENLK